MSTNQNHERQSFKGESLANGKMDTMHGKLTDTRPRVKVYPAPVAVEPKAEAETQAAE